MHSPYLPLLLITLLAAIVPVLTRMFRWLRLPIVVGEILAGIAIGQSGLNLVQPTPALEFLSEFGFTFLMFLSGLEVDLHALRRMGGATEQSGRWRGPLPLALASFALTVGLASLVGWALVAAGLARNAILMGLILSTTSLGIVLPILKERALTATGYGQFLLVAALVSDFATLLLLSVVMAILSQGLTLDLLLVMVLLVAFVAVARLMGRATQHPLLTRITDELSHATAQIRLRGVFALLVLWAVLAEVLGVEVILGAFLAGVLVSLANPGHSSPLREKLDAIGYGFLIPIFFISVGARFDLRSLLDSPQAVLLVPVLLVAAYAVKVLPALLYRARFSWRESLAAGVLLSSRLSLIVAASAIALERDLVSPATNSAVVLVAVVTCTISPVLFGRLLPPTPTSVRQGTLILGSDQLAMRLGERLRQRGEMVALIHPADPDHEPPQVRDIPIHVGDPAQASTLLAAGIEQAEAVVVLAVDPARLQAVCGLARERFAVPTVVARVDDPALAQELASQGVHVVQPAFATLMAVEGALRFPAAFALLADQEDGVEIGDARLTRADVLGTPIRAVQLPGGVRLLGIRRAHDVIVPQGNTILQRDDVLMVIGSRAGLEEAQAWLDPEHSPRGAVRVPTADRR